MADIVQDDFAEPADGQPHHAPDLEPTSRFAVPRRRGQTTLKAVPKSTVAPQRDPFAHPLDRRSALEDEVDLDEEFIALRQQITELDVRVREQIEIERMRDLELGRLEQELEQKSQRLAAVDVDLFHERRRSAELDRRWNVLNALFEDTASSLVQTGATLDAICSQRSYRAIVAVVRMMQRHRSTDAILGFVSRRAPADRAD